MRSDSQLSSMYQRPRATGLRYAPGTLPGKGLVTLAHFAKVRLDAQIASWDILWMPVDSKATNAGSHILATEYAVREHMGYPVPELTT